MKLWQKDVNLCWTIGSVAQACGTTDLDTGMPFTVVNTTVSTTMPFTSNVLQSGTPVSLASPSGEPLWSFAAGSTDGDNKVRAESLGSETMYNTGIAFYYTHVVGFDWANGQLLVTPKS